MTNGTGIDHAQMTMMTALIQFKKAHGVEAYLNLLARFNAARWQDIPATAHGDVVLTCKRVPKSNAAHKATTNASADDEDDDAPSIAAGLNKIAAKVYGDKAANTDFATIAAGAPDIATAFDRYAVATHARLNK